MSRTGPSSGSQLRKRIFAGICSSCGMRKSALFCVPTLVPIQTFVGAAPIDLLVTQSRSHVCNSNAPPASSLCFIAFTSRDIQFSGLLVSSSQSRFGVAWMSASRSASHSIGTSSSSQSASDAQKTRGRRKVNVTSGPVVVTPPHEHDNTFSRRAVLHFSQIFVEFHFNGSRQFAALVRSRGAPFPQ